MCAHNLGKKLTAKSDFCGFCEINVRVLTNFYVKALFILDVFYGWDRQTVGELVVLDTRTCAGDISVEVPVNTESGQAMG